MPPRQRTHPPGAIYERAAQFQDELELGQQAAADQILAAHAQAYERVRGDYQDLLDKIQAARVAGTPPSPAWLYQQERLQNALDRTQRELHRYAQQASQAALQAQELAVRASAQHHARLGEEAVSRTATLATSFVQINEANTRHLVGHLADGSPLADLFASFAAETADMAKAALVEGLTLGKGVDWMARQLTAALDMPRHRAVTIMRTETMRTYRAVARETYQANAELLEGWVWHAKLGPRTCAACIAMHGTVHPVTETLDGHPRCRCAMVPRTKSWDDILGEPSDLPDTRPPLEDGKAWLAAQPERTQRAILGPAKLKAWKAGRITLDDVVARTHSRTWGTMRRERSLVEILEGRNANVLPGQPEQRRPVERREPALTEGQQAALMPRRGGWTTSTRAKTVAELKATPEGRVLLKTLDSFQSGGATAIPRLRTDIEAYLAGGHDLAEGRVESITTLLRSIAHSDAGDRPLYRGMSIPGTVEDVLARYSPGSSQNISLASFSSDAKLAQGFSIKGAGQRVKGATQTPVVVEWVGEGKRALPIENLGKSRVFAEEREWVGAGEYVVEAAKVAKRGGVQTVVVTVRQARTW